MNTDKHGSGLIGIGLQFIQPHGRSWKISQTLFVPVCIHLWLISFCLFSFSADATAQVRPVYDRGTTGLVQLLKRLNTSASVMMIGAHPDDEDTALLAYLARGENARTAYLSLTRGDGGQNIIGPELGEALGVIRTEELLQARRLDGAEQYFTRAYDYGFSKTLDEAKQKWDEKIILCDVVRVIREFRPLVVVSQFSGTAADGHGQHQFSGYITPLAIKAAADSTQCRDAGPAWNVRKLYVRHGFRATTEPRLRVNTGKYDPVLGRSYFEIAMEARSQHKSQEQGVLELKGDAFSGLNLVGSETKETGVFDGLNISIKGIAENTNNVEGSFIEKLETLQAIANRVLSEYDVRNPASILPMLTEGYKLSETAEASTRTPASKAFLETKSKQFLDAIRLAAGIQIDAIADKETVIPSEQFGTVVRLFFPLSDSVKVNDVVLNVPQGWTVSPTEPQAVTPQGAFRRETAKHTASYTLKVADDAKPAQPYWLEQQREGDMFRWKNDDNQTLPFQPPVASAKVTFVIHGVEVAFTQPVEYRFADDVRGEIRRPLEVVPRISLSFDQDLVMVARNTRETIRQMSVTVTNNSSTPVSGEVLVTPPKGGSIEQQSSEFRFARKGESDSLTFKTIVPANVPAGQSLIAAFAKIDKAQHYDSMRTIAYPHIQTHRMYAAATARVNVLDLKTTPVKVGYIAGSGDKVPQAILQMGLDLTVIDERTLASGDLSRFDVIVVGIRAYQVRPDLVANNKRLLDFASNGGTLIVQYQLPGYSQQNLMPFPAQMGPRVADENAKVTILKPDHPVFSFPNKITDADFTGWVQERNLYNFSTMDSRYTPLLESHDTGEPENGGGLVIADVGKGKYIYCSYSLFRQLPAGVPGAFRLFANMLSIKQSK